MTTLDFFENELVPVARRLNKIHAAANVRTNAATPARDRQAVSMYFAATWQALHAAALAVRCKLAAAEVVAPLLQALVPTVASLGADHEKMLQVLRATEASRTRLLSALGTSTAQYSAWAATALASRADGLPFKGRRSASWWTSLVDTRLLPSSHPRYKRAEELRALLRALDSASALVPLESYLSVSVCPRTHVLLVTAEFTPQCLPTEVQALLPLAAKAPAEVSHAVASASIQLLTDVKGLAGTVDQLRTWHENRVAAAKVAAVTLEDISAAKAMERARATLAKLKPQDREALRKLLAEQG